MPQRRQHRFAVDTHQPHAEDKYQRDGGKNIDQVMEQCVNII